MSAVAFRCHSKAFFKFLMKIAAVFIADMYDNIANGQSSGAQKVRCDVKALTHEKLFKGYPEMATYPAA